MAEAKTNRVLMLSDVHLCHLNWFGMTSEQRLDKMVRDLNEEFVRDPYDMVLFLGDYSLDFWVCNEGGSYLNEGHISNTANIIQKYFSQLPAPFYMLPGNHEQYAPETWKAITGFDRYYTVPYGEFVFIMLDTFSGNLGPDFHSDGTYEPADVNYIRKVMTENPGKKFFLCAHDFYTHEESEGFKKLLKEPDILGLFAGHTHESRVFWLGEEFGKKCLIRTGNYAYSHAFEGQFASWGWRELKTDVAHRKVFTEYILPETVYTVKGEKRSHERFRRDGIELRY
ncbi:MAG: metallophosphoesterase [Clostridia bacterium]|nr:metallophosphoesterase [Clostridia bacterium]